MASGTHASLSAIALSLRTPGAPPTAHPAAAVHGGTGLGLHWLGFVAAGALAAEAVVASACPLRELVCAPLITASISEPLDSDPLDDVGEELQLLLEEWGASSSVPEGVPGLL